MSRSGTYYTLQQIDTAIDSAERRLQEIARILGDDRAIKLAEKELRDFQSAADQKAAVLKKCETQVTDQNFKIEQNQKKLYGGAITNPKELEDLQQEANSLGKYLLVLEDKQLEAMIDFEEAQSLADKASSTLDSLMTQRERDLQVLLQEQADLRAEIARKQGERDRFLNSKSIPDLDLYDQLRRSCGGIAVTLMLSSSCQSCGANIPSAIEQQARSSSKLANCPTCKRILYPG